MVVIINGYKYIKLKRHEKIKPLAYQSFSYGKYIPVNDEKIIGKIPAKFSIHRQFYNRVTCWYCREHFKEGQYECKTCVKYDMNLV